jgi:dTDP-4-dehydrorhamnose 3,5-epimerase-like enzyme
MSIRTFAGEPAAAWRAALAGSEPLFLPAQVHVDDRGWSLMNQLRGVLAPEGQVNFSLQNPGVTKAWHRHHLQTDFWLCVLGSLKVGVHREIDGRSWSLVFGQMRPGVVVIPPTLWHGTATLGSDPAGLLYYVTRAYDPAAPDEERRPFDSVPDFSWAVENR